MHASSGGALSGQDTVNAYGKVANPPPEWLYDPAIGSSLAGRGGGSGGRLLAQDKGSNAARGGVCVWCVCVCMYVCVCTCV